MTHLAVAYEVDYNITAEFLSVLCSNAESVSNIVHLVGVDVEDRCADSRGHFGTVGA